MWVVTLLPATQRPLSPQPPLHLPVQIVLALTPLRLVQSLVSLKQFIPA